MSEKEIKEEQTIEEMNLWQRIHAVSTEVGRVAMTLAVDTGKGKSYKAVSINDVVDSLIPVLGKYRLVVVPGDKEIIEQSQITTTTQYGERAQFFIRLRAEFHIVNIDKPTEFITVSGFGDGIDSGDKATGKANTYARKYALIDAFNLSKGDDPDKDASQEYKKITYATAEQVTKVKVLYSDEEISKMLKRMKKENLYACTTEQVEKMIASRDHSAIEDNTPTY